MFTQEICPTELRLGLEGQTMFLLKSKREFQNPAHPTTRSPRRGLCCLPRFSRGEIHGACPPGSFDERPFHGLLCLARRGRERRSRAIVEGTKGNEMKSSGSSTVFILNCLPFEASAKVDSPAHGTRAKGPLSEPARFLYPEIFFLSR